MHGIAYDTILCQVINKKINAINSILLTMARDSEAAEVCYHLLKQALFTLEEAF